MVNFKGMDKAYIGYDKVKSEKNRKEWQDKLLSEYNKIKGKILEKAATFGLTSGVVVTVITKMISSIPENEAQNFLENLTSEEDFKTALLVGAATFLSTGLVRLGMLTVKHQETLGDLMRAFKNMPPSLSNPYLEPKIARAEKVISVANASKNDLSKGRF